MADLNSIERETRLVLDAANGFARDAAALPPGTAFAEMLRTRKILVEQNTSRLLGELAERRMMDGTSDPARNAIFSRLQGMLYRAQQLATTKPGGKARVLPKGQGLGTGGETRDTVPPSRPRAQPRTMRPRAPTLWPKGPSREFESLSEAVSMLDGEADSMSGGMDKRSRRNRQEAIRVDRTRTDRAQQRAGNRAQQIAARRRAKQSALTKLRAMTPGAVQRTLAMTVRPELRARPDLMSALYAAVNSTLLSTFAGLMADAGDGGGDITNTTLSAAIATAVATAAARTGLIGQIDVAQTAKILNGIYASSIALEMKVLATPFVIAVSGAASRRGRSQSEAFYAG